MKKLIKIKNYTNRNFIIFINDEKFKIPKNGESEISFFNPRKIFIIDLFLKTLFLKAKSNTIIIDPKTEQVYYYFEIQNIKLIPKHLYYVLFILILGLLSIVTSLKLLLLFVLFLFLFLVNSLFIENILIHKL